MGEIRNILITLSTCQNQSTENYKTCLKIQFKMYFFFFLKKDHYYIKDMIYDRK